MVLWKEPTQAQNSEYILFLKDIHTAKNYESEKKPMFDKIVN